MARVFVSDPDVGLEVIGVDRFGLVSNGSGDKGMKGLPLHVGDALDTDVSPSLDGTSHPMLVVPPVLPAPLAADHRFVNASGTTMPAVTLEQDGEKLTGRYSSDNLGLASLTGIVSGSEITFTFSADNLLGQLAPVTYTGTVDEEGEITGTMNIAGGLVTETLTAVRSGG